MYIQQEYGDALGSQIRLRIFYVYLALSLFLFGTVRLIVPHKTKKGILSISRGLGYFVGALESASRL
jgi:hypothetical protein